MTITALKHSARAVPQPNTGSFFSPLHRQMEQLMDDFFTQLPFSIKSESPIGWMANPPMNISEGDKRYMVTLEVPGMELDDIELSVADNTLQIKGEKSMAKEEKQNGYVSMERSFGSFYRSVPFTSHIDESRIRATLKNGVLNIEIPKSVESTKSHKKISIQKN